MTLQYVTTPLTNSPVVLADFLTALLEANEEDLGIAEDSIYYGDQEKIPKSPTVCVEPDMTTRTLDGAPRRAFMIIRIYIFIYHGEVRDPQYNRRDSDLLAEKVSRLIHENPYMGGKVIDSMITEAQSGYSTKQNSLMRSHRLQLECRTYDYLPQEV